MNESTHKDTKSWSTILVTIIILALFIIMTSTLIFRRVEKEIPNTEVEDGLIRENNAFQ